MGGGGGVGGGGDDDDDDDNDDDDDYTPLQECRIMHVHLPPKVRQMRFVVWCLRFVICGLGFVV